GEFNGLANLDRMDRNDLSRSPLAERGAGVIPALTPAVEGALGAPVETLERMPAVAGATPGAAEAEAGGGADHPNPVGQGPPVTTAAKDAHSAPASQQPLTASQTPASTTAATAAAVADANALAHGLAQPTAKPPVTASPKHAPIRLGPTGPSILVTGPDTG